MRGAGALLHAFDIALTCHAVFSRLLTGRHDTKHRMVEALTVPSGAQNADFSPHRAVTPGAYLPMSRAYGDHPRRVERAYGQRPPVKDVPDHKLNPYRFARDKMRAITESGEPCECGLKRGIKPMGSNEQNEWHVVSISKKQASRPAISHTLMTHPSTPMTLPVPMAPCAQTCILPLASSQSGPQSRFATRTAALIPQCPRPHSPPLATPTRLLPRSASTDR